MPNPRRRKTTVARSRKNLFPGEYRKRSTVYVERVRKNDEDRRYTDSDSLMTTDAYIVMTRRMDTDWTFIMESGGKQVMIPAKVMDRFMVQRERIIKEQRSDRGKERAAQPVEEAQPSDIVDFPRRPGETWVTTLAQGYDGQAILGARGRTLHIVRLLDSRGGGYRGGGDGKAAEF